MTSISEAIYTATSFNIKAIAPQMNPLSAMGDCFMLWIHNSLSKHRIIWMLVHQNQALWRRITKLGLVTLFHTYTSFHKVSNIHNAVAPTDSGTYCAHV